MTETNDAEARIRSTYREFGGDDCSGRQLLTLVAGRVRVPRRDPADSFVLHAPLEVMARGALLPWVHPRGMECARLRIVAVLDQFEEVPAVPVAVESAGARDTVNRERGEPTVLAGRLIAALEAGDLEAIDAAAIELSGVAAPAALPALLGDAVLPVLAAAGHAPIFLYQYPRVAPRGEVTAELLRPLARELGRYPELRLNWMRERPSSGGSVAGLADALRNVPLMGVPDSTFIFPVMHQVDAGGVAQELLGPSLAGVAVEDAARVLLRTAARAMLTASPEHAAYGWSHCLTMPQAALGIAPFVADRQLALDVAGTYVVGFLAALATEPIPDGLDFADPGGSFRAALTTSRESAAGFVLHADESSLHSVVTELVTEVCAHRDAHLVKYTLACLDAAAADPPARRLFLAAAASLLASWLPIDDPDDPLWRWERSVIVTPE